MAKKKTKAIPGRRKSGKRPGPAPGQHVSPETEFKPGISGNPSGVTAEIAAARSEALRIAALASPKAMNKVVAMAESASKEDGVELAANREILDRGLGRSVQHVEAKIIEGFIVELPKLEE